MQHAQAVFVGVDVAKATLSSCIHGANVCQELANSAVAIRAWLQALPAAAWIAVESTGRHHLLLVTLAHASGRRAFVLNAHDVFFYAKALGQRGKTDRADARLIARYLAEHHALLRPWTPPTATQAGLQALLRCRAGLASKRSALRQMLRDVDALQPEADVLEDTLAAVLARIDAKIAGLLAADTLLQPRAALLRTIPGVGAQGSAMLAALFSRMPFANVEAVVAYSGLDPRPQDSGASRGRRRLSKRGSPALRRQLYLCAFAATRSKALRPLYAALKANGFKPTQALVILARKLLRIAWAVWNRGVPFDPALVGKGGACTAP